MLNDDWWPTLVARINQYELILFSVELTKSSVFAQFDQFNVVSIHPRIVKMYLAGKGTYILATRASFQIHHNGKVNWCHDRYSVRRLDDWCHTGTVPSLDLVVKLSLCLLTLFGLDEAHLLGKCLDDTWVRQLHFLVRNFLFPSWIAVRRMRISAVTDIRLPLLLDVYGFKL